MSNRADFAAAILANAARRDQQQADIRSWALVLKRGVLGAQAQPIDERPGTSAGLFAERRVFADRAGMGATDPVIAAWVAKVTAEAEQIKL